MMTGSGSGNFPLALQILACGSQCPLIKIPLAQYASGSHLVASNFGSISKCPYIAYKSAGLARPTLYNLSQKISNARLIRNKGARKCCVQQCQKKPLQFNRRIVITNLPSNHNFLIEGNKFRIDRLNRKTEISKSRTSSDGNNISNNDDATSICQVYSRSTRIIMIVMTVRPYRWTLHYATEFIIAVTNTSPDYFTQVQSTYLIYII